MTMETNVWISVVENVNRAIFGEFEFDDDMNIGYLVFFWILFKQRRL